MTISRDNAVDALERAFVLLLYGGLAARVLAAPPSAAGATGNLLLLVSEGMVVVFLLLRRGTHDVSTSAPEWLLAFAATSLPMLVAPAPGRALVPPFAGGVVLMAGMLIELHAKLVLGKSFGCVPANRGLKTTGPYRLVRHPIYAGYLLGHVGFFLMNASLRNFVLYAGCVSLQIPRLLAEERLLRHDDGYRRYQAKVRYRLIPGVF